MPDAHKLNFPQVIYSLCNVCLLYAIVISPSYFRLVSSYSSMEKNYESETWLQDILISYFVRKGHIPYQTPESQNMTELFACLRNIRASQVAQ